MFGPYLRRWNLVSDGEPIATHSSDLLPVRSGDAPAMLKVARSEEERRGASLMAWWDGTGAARVLAHHGDAILLERAVGRRSLTSMAHQGHDDEASRIICGVAAKLHAHHGSPPATLNSAVELVCGAVTHCRNRWRDIHASRGNGERTPCRATGGVRSAWRPASRQCAGLWRARLARDRSEGVDRRSRIRFCQHPLQPQLRDCDESGTHGSPDRCDCRSGPARPGAAAALDPRLRRTLRSMDHRRWWRSHSRFDHGTHGSSGNRGRLTQFTDNDCRSEREHGKAGGEVERRQRLRPGEQPR